MATVYTTREAVRAAAGVDNVALPDAEADRLIRQAEVLVDEYLGFRGLYESGPSAGRKVAEADVKAWIWQAIDDATATLAATIFAHPERFDESFESVSGPGYSASKRRSSILGVQVTTTLNGTGLVRRTARGRA